MKNRNPQIRLPTAVPLDSTGPVVGRAGAYAAGAGDTGDPATACGGTVGAGAGAPAGAPIGAPHFTQNWLPSAFAAPHRTQNMVKPPQQIYGSIGARSRRLGYLFRLQLSTKSARRHCQSDSRRRE